jgi:hypothetical protein
MYQCKHCKRPVHDYTTKGINEWMQDAVVLMEDVSRLVGEFDSEHGHKVGNRETGSGGMWLHKVCWEAAGRPEFDAYERPSKRVDELSYKDEELWVVSPEITDKAERERVLAEGIAAHEQRLFDDKANRVDDWVEQDPEWETEQQRERPWEQRFQVLTYPEQDNTVQIHDALDDTAVRYEDFDGTEEEAETECKRRWNEWLLSDEFKALRARRKELEAQWEAKHMAELKEKGRFDVGYRPSKKGGDVMDGRKMGRTMFYVKDRLTYEDVIEFDFSDELAPKEYESDPAFDGNQSAEWETRVEEFRAETGRIRALADTACARLNAAWAEAGYPGKDWVWHPV